ncbi:hypothetical protein LEN26_007341 [Aphanomyces euteiches]|nr:hypothetical protein AeMF1_018367 [Aphanomyces euteiches]KAH9132660.1 hypothetical protein LEN26_007341 [Aphanomyces euteiches]KAH9192161.1 hypothetical protein AeNC1_005868 [Aphanomyces euteiches]
MDDGAAFQHEIIHVQDKWAELLPSRIPLRYAFFRYLGFCIKVRSVPGHTAAKALKPSPTRASVWIKVTTSKGVALEQKIPACFKDGVYYVQDITLQDEGLHTFHVWVESQFFTSVKPFVHELHVHQFMRLHDDSNVLFGGPYGPLRQVVDPMLFDNLEKEIEVDWTDELVQHCLKKSKTKLRPVDAKWWMRQFVEQGELQAKKRRQLHKASERALLRSKSLCRHPRKQARPVRSGDKRDHENYFQGRQRELKRQKTRQIRIFVHESLSANETHVVFSKREFYHQLALYSKKQK